MLIAMPTAGPADGSAGSENVNSGVSPGRCSTEERPTGHSSVYIQVSLYWSELVPPGRPP